MSPSDPTQPGIADYEPDDPQADAIEDDDAPGRGLVGEGDGEVAEPNEPA